MSVLSAEVNCIQVLLAVECVTHTFRLQINFQVHSVVDNNVQFVLKLLHFVGITNHVHNFLFVRFQYAVALHYFPDTFLVFSKCRKLCIDARLVFDADLFSVVTKHLNVAVVNVFSVNFHDRSNRVSIELD